MPTLVLYAANDPFIRITQETRRKMALNPNIKFVETADGGHCAFIGVPARGAVGGNGNNNAVGSDDGYWAEREIVNFLRRY